MDVGEGGCKESGPHPAVCKMARRWTRLMSLAAFVGGVVALHYFPKHRSAVAFVHVQAVCLWHSCTCMLYACSIPCMCMVSACILACVPPSQCRAAYVLCCCLCHWNDQANEWVPGQSRHIRLYACHAVCVAVDVHGGIFQTQTRYRCTHTHMYMYTGMI